MDPVSQGVLGASVPQAVSKPKTIVAATLFGALAGMAPDLDFLIRSDTDPLVYLKYHRQFTHSLIFIPVGGFICALVFHGLLGRRWQILLADQVGSEVEAVELEHLDVHTLVLDAGSALASRLESLSVTRPALASLILADAVSHHVDLPWIRRQRLLSRLARNALAERSQA